MVFQVLYEEAFPNRSAENATLPPAGGENVPRVFSENLKEFEIFTIHNSNHIY